MGDGENLQALDEEQVALLLILWASGRGGMEWKRRHGFRQLGHDGVTVQEMQLLLDPKREGGPARLGEHIDGVFKSKHTIPKYMYALDNFPNLVKIVKRSTLGRNGYAYTLQSSMAATEPVTAALVLELLENESLERSILVERVHANGIPWKDTRQPASMEQVNDIVDWLLRLPAEAAYLVITGGQRLGVLNRAKLEKLYLSAIAQIRD